MELSASKHRQLQYPREGLREDLRLLEVDDAMLSKIIASGWVDRGDLSLLAPNCTRTLDVVAWRRVVIKGGENDDLVLCSDDRTYALKYVETTNTLLMVLPAQVRPPDMENHPMQPHEMHPRAFC